MFRIKFVRYALYARCSPSIIFWICNNIHGWNSSCLFSHKNVCSWKETCCRSSIVHVILKIECIAWTLNYNISTATKRCQRFIIWLGLYSVTVACWIIIRKSYVYWVLDVHAYIGREKRNVRGRKRRPVSWWYGLAFVERTHIGSDCVHTWTLVVGFCDGSTTSAYYYHKF